MRRYIRNINVLGATPRVEGLRAYPALHYEKLIGDKAGLSSIRVNDKYRIEFTVTEGSAESLMQICDIVELSNHYK